MAKKPVRGRFFIKVPLDGGGSWTCESFKEKSLSGQEIAKALRNYANFIEEFLLGKANAQPEAVGAVARPDGISNEPTTRD